MNVIFRVDASVQMGTGHLMRCLNLAHLLRARGASVRFICREHDGHLIGRLRSEAMPVASLPAAPDAAPCGSADYAAWLGVPQAQDASESIEAIQGALVDWLIMDHYALDAEWERRLRPHVERLMVIDDLANRSHDCDLLLDQNLVPENHARYRNLVPSTCRLLLGPRYALLGPEYRVWRRSLRPREGQVGRVLVFLGGSDPENVSLRVIEALMAPEFLSLDIDVVIGSSNPHRASLEMAARRRPRTTLYGPRPNLADLMAQADLAIGAGGATTWERMSLGLPSLVLSIADNQRPACEAMAAADLIHYVGDARSMDKQQFQCRLAEMLNDPAGLVRIADAGVLMVDGLGAMRVVEVLHPTPSAQLRLRPAREMDVTLYFDWVNEPEVRRQALNHNLIPWVSHQHWFHQKLTDDSSRLFVLEADDLPVGQVRFDLEGDEARIDYALDPIVRGRGWGARLVALGAAAFGSERPEWLRAEVKVGNLASRAVFLRLGFVEHAEQHGLDGVCVFRSPPSRVEQIA